MQSHQFTCFDRYYHRGEVVVFRSADHKYFSFGVIRKTRSAPTSCDDLEDLFSTGRTISSFPEDTRRLPAKFVPSAQWTLDLAKQHFLEQESLVVSVTEEHTPPYYMSIVLASVDTHRWCMFTRAQLLESFGRARNALTALQSEYPNAMYPDQETYRACLMRLNVYYISLKTLISVCSYGYAADDATLHIESTALFQILRQYEQTPKAYYPPFHSTADPEVPSPAPAVHPLIADENSVSALNKIPSQVVSAVASPNRTPLLQQLRLARHQLTALQAEFPEQRYPNQESFRYNSTALKQYEAPLQLFHSSSQGAFGLELESEFRGDIGMLISLWETFSSPASVDTIQVDNQPLVAVDAPHRELLSQLAQVLSRAHHLLSIHKTDQQFAAQHISQYELCLASMLTIEQLCRDCPHKTELPTSLLQRLSITQSVVKRIVENVTVVVQAPASTIHNTEVNSICTASKPRVEPHRNFLQRKQYRSASNKTGTTWNRTVTTRATAASPPVTTRVAEAEEITAACSTGTPRKGSH